ncbi:PTS glucitol/sorbitol transporter subunit IIA [Salipaludibacillus sp. CUR1]|uniref:PTS glucitol/sorbitol transporter subunit IIA n=1 Tax=Salipaludibacillus sp. CUR1 TaxID=2820003 RepID=UPI001E5A5C42|nr:PTS glucitol/sorbitol transporter subunit IIA [Salipaludibacillus sp. CUR1]MCE7792920.1 PTS glucitol/sorbitol transporter subunit IIA [Salipaludibacillus sp. CUR1]
MMAVIYETNVVELGSMVEGFYEDQMIILFKTGAPEEMKDYCVLHEKNKLHKDVQVGDTLYIDEVSYEVTAVGSAVNENLNQLGHITLSFYGKTEPDLPGYLCLENKKIKPVEVGSTLKITRN